jgi:electron transfer flavoprotein beta subunit
VADYLDIPQVTYVFDIEEVNEKHVVVKRRLEDGFERIQCPLPALLTVIGELNEPRHARVDRLIDACREKAPIKIWNAADLGVQVSEVGLPGSLTQVIKTFAPKTQRQSQILEGDVPGVVDELIGKLRENRMI